jgi:putative ABC transport system substrate-binding protein
MHHIERRALLRGAAAGALAFTVGGAELLLTPRAARALGEINTAFASLAERQIDAIVIGVDTLFVNRRVQLVTLAAHHRLPAIYPLREFAEAGGLMSYGSNFPDLFRQTGIYVGRVLKGETPAALPVLRATRFEFVLNLQTAKALGLQLPDKLLSLADDVIE